MACPNSEVAGVVLELGDDNLFLIPEDSLAQERGGRTNPEHARGPVTKCSETQRRPRHHAGHDHATPAEPFAEASRRRHAEGATMLRQRRDDHHRQSDRDQDGGPEKLPVREPESKHGKPNSAERHRGRGTNQSEAAPGHRAHDRARTGCVCHGGCHGGCHGHADRSTPAIDTTGKST
jgi:hypothetical protein